MTWVTVGYSGSRDGMAKPQVIGIFRHISYLFLTHDSDPGIEGVKAHHGDCIGGDYEFHTLATALNCFTVAHPPKNESRRAYCKADEIRRPKNYADRDRDIATETAGLIAAPGSFAPVPHSGTWLTICLALQLGRPVTVILPDGQARSGLDFADALLAGSRR